MFAPAHASESKTAARSLPQPAKLVPFFQAKLTVNQSGDAHEQEADRVADQVMRMPAFMPSVGNREGHAPIVQQMPLTPVSHVMRACAACGKEEAQRKESGTGDAGGKAAPSIVSDMLSSGGGQPMDGGTKHFMESRFGQDFSQVRVHTDSRAAESASAIQARAYTSGRDVVFGRGEYQPGTDSGKRLLAHELVHVGQQESGLQRAIQRKDYGTFVSTVGDQSYLDAAAEYYKGWGHAGGVQRVGTMDALLTQLAKTSDPIDHFRLVSHGSRIGLQFGLTAEISPDTFNSPQTKFSDPVEFRKIFTGINFVSESAKVRLIAALQKDPATAPHFQTLSTGGTPVPVNTEDPLGILLRAAIDNFFLDTVELDTGGKPKPPANWGIIRAFDALKSGPYKKVLVSTFPTASQAAAGTAVDEIVKALPTVAASIKFTFNPLTQTEVNDLANPILDPNATSARLSPDLKRAAEEGAGGTFMKNLATVKQKVSTGTHVEIRGCNVGKNPTYMDEFRKFFERPATASAPAELPAMSAPDLYQYFWKMGFQTYLPNATSQQQMQTHFNDPTTGVAKNFQDTRRMRAGEAVRVTIEADLDQVAKRHGKNAADLHKMNPEVPANKAVNQGDLIWLAHRPALPAGRFTDLATFCQAYLGTSQKADIEKVQKASSLATPTTSLSPGTMLIIPPQLLTGKKTAAPDATFADFKSAVDGGEAVLAFDSNSNAPVFHMDDSKWKSALSTWVAGQHIDPKSRTAAQLGARYNISGGRIVSSQAGTYLEFLSPDYPRVTDMIVPEDPSYASHFIKRP